MKLSAIVNDAGTVVSTAQVGKFKAADGHEVEFGIIPGPGQRVYEVDVPDSMATRPPAEVHAEVQRLLQTKATSFQSQETQVGRGY